MYLIQILPYLNAINLQPVNWFTYNNLKVPLDILLEKIRDLSLTYQFQWSWVHLHHLHYQRSAVYCSFLYLE